MTRVSWYLALVASALLCSCKSNGTKGSPVQISDDEQTKLQGKAYFHDRPFGTGSELRAEIYNGSDWVVTDLDIEVQKLKTGEARRFRVELWQERREFQAGTQFPNITKERQHLRPYSTAQMTAEAGDYANNIKTKDDWSWGIVSARGYKE